MTEAAAGGSIAGMHNRRWNPCTAFLLCVALVAAAAPVIGQDRPNVIVVLVDDLGWADLGCQGSTYYETPAIDRLASEGMRFTDAYAACAVCSPTRAALMTGRYPARVGVTDWIRARFQRGRQCQRLFPTTRCGRC